jgi:serine/threonine-protein kinase RsbW
MAHPTDPRPEPFRAVPDSRQAVPASPERSALGVALRAGRHVRPAWACCGPGGSASWVFLGRGEQVRAVRAFARSVLAGHPAVDDAVMVASELGANAVTHSASGRHGGLFMVHLAWVSATHAAVIVTDQGAGGALRIKAADGDAESGRGLAVVRALSHTVEFSRDASGLRSVLAVVPADPPCDLVKPSDHAACPA